MKLNELFAPSRINENLNAEIRFEIKKRLQSPDDNSPERRQNLKNLEDSLDMHDMTIEWPDDFDELRDALREPEMLLTPIWYD